MNRINHLFESQGNSILSIYFTAGYPELGNTREILSSLQSAGADLIEIGIPYSDPVADGPTIQESNQKALDNGMSMKLLFEQLQEFRNEIALPIILMGYVNPIMQFGVEAFCSKCREVGIDGLILPDLPMNEYKTEYKETFKRYGLLNIFLITPQTSEERIREIDENSEGFIYMVSSASITGAKGKINAEQVKYFERIDKMQLKNPKLIGFGISNKETFSTACQYAQGAIIGSAFINLIDQSKDLDSDIKSYIHSVKS